MNKSTKIILTFLIFTLIFSLPVVAYGLKSDINKKNLHIDNERYSEVNYVCFTEKSSNDCLNFLKEDLDILIGAHKHNKEFCRSGISFKNPQYLIKYAYKLRENEISIEPEIFIKTMLIKKVLFKDMKKHVQTGLFGEEMENYIADNFSEPNRSEFVKILENQDENFEKYLKKKQLKNIKKVTGPTPVYQGLAYDF